MKRCIVSWSGGKDSALALQRVLADGGYHVTALLTIITGEYDRISMHGIRRSLLREQADALGLPLIEVEIPPHCSNEVYEAVTLAALARPMGSGVDTVVFGDLFLQDVREYREKLIRPTGLDPIFPLWGMETATLARQFVGDGFRAVLCTVDPRQLDASFCGRDYDQPLLAELPPAVDPCGERGEFHTFVFSGPLFARPLIVSRGECVERDGFWFCELRGERNGNAADAAS